MEEYVLLIILIAFVIYILCNRKQYLVEGFNPEEMKLLKESLGEGESAMNAEEKIAAKAILAEASEADIRLMMAGTDISETQKVKLLSSRLLPEGHGFANNELSEIMELGKTNRAGAGSLAERRTSEAATRRVEAVAAEEAERATEAAAADAVIAEEEDVAQTATLSDIEKAKVPPGKTLHNNMKAKGYKIKNGKVYKDRLLRSDKELSGEELATVERRMEKDGDGEITGKFNTMKEQDEIDARKMAKDGNMTYEDARGSIKSARGSKWKGITGSTIALTATVSLIAAAYSLSDTEASCIMKCEKSNASDSDWVGWMSAHEIDPSDTTTPYYNNCTMGQGRDQQKCNTFCSNLLSSTEGESLCSRKKRHAAGWHRVMGGLGEVLGPFDEILANIEELFEQFLPYILGGLGIFCCLPLLILIIYNVLRKKVVDTGSKMLGVNLDEAITASTGIMKSSLKKVKSGGGQKHFELNNPKTIILIVFFIFIIYNGSRNTGTHRRKSYNINNRCN